MRPSRGLGPQRTILYFLVALRSGLRATLVVTTESSHIPNRASIVGPPDVATIAVSCRISRQSCFGWNLEWFSFNHGRPRF
jgi:hypothetical protein